MRIDYLRIRKDCDSMSASVGELRTELENLRQKTEKYGQLLQSDSLNDAYEVIGSLSARIEELRRIVDEQAETVSDTMEYWKKMERETGERIGRI